MRHVHAREVVAVHHGLELRQRRVDEQRRVRAAGAAPDDVRRAPVVPLHGLGDDARALGRGCHVRADVVEALDIGRSSSFLRSFEKSKLADLILPRRLVMSWLRIIS